MHSKVVDLLKVKDKDGHMKLGLTISIFAAGIMMMSCQKAPATEQTGSNSEQAQGRAMPNADSPSAASSLVATANGALDSQGRMALTIGDWSLKLSASDCEQRLDHVQWCKRDVQLNVEGPGGIKQLIPLESVYLDSESTAYVGSLSGRYREKGYSIVFGDIDGDGHQDLMVWTGREGGYAGASYDVFLFNAETKQFVRNLALTELMLGATAPFIVDDGRLKLAFKDGCCLHIFDTYELQGNEPVLVERVTEDSTVSGQTKKTIERLVDGKLEIVGGDDALNL